MESKKKSQRNHARRRALERYGVSVGKRRRNALIKAIQNSGAVHLYSASNRCSTFAINHEDEWYAVVYDNLRKEIATFLPKSVLEKYAELLGSKGYCSLEGRR